MSLRLFFLSILCFLAIPPAFGATTLTAVRVMGAPQIDGDASDLAWQQSTALLVRDQIAKVDVTLKAVATGDTVYFLASYPDPEENSLHKPWVWDDKLEAYKLGRQREDAFVFKWAMQPINADLSNFSDEDYTADVWYWKAHRTNPAGFADDKHHVLGATSAPKAKELSSKTGKKRFLQRLGDTGTSTTKKRMLLEKLGEIEPQYEIRQPSGSRADVLAKGAWKGGFWTIEFARKLDTGHSDDVVFQGPGPFPFGVSVFGLYGNALAPNKPHLYGQGRISEPLNLILQ